MLENVSFLTNDQVTINGLYQVSEQAPNKVAILLHMMPAIKESWGPFAQTLEEEYNIASLAIDLRGHGNSIKQQGTILNYLSFDEKEHRASIFDVEAALRYLTEERGIAEDKIVLAGASIGANLALWFAAEHPDVRRIVLLSPGYNYKGIETKPLAKQLSDKQGVFIAAGSKDIRGNGMTASDMAKGIYELLVGPKELKIYETDKHGTDLLTMDPSLAITTGDWLNA